MGDSTIRPAVATDRDAVVATITLAFSADPLARWANPSSTKYLSLMPQLVEAFCGNGFAYGSVYVSEDASGAAMWLPPGIEPDFARMDELMQSNVPEAILPDLGALMEQMSLSHPDAPHWYLPLIGVDPAAQGRGLGGALMAHALKRCDEEGSAAYLESSNPRNIGFYQRWGFEIVRTIQVGASPPVTPMLRAPR